MSLDPRLLHAFVILAEDLHFGRAAGRLHIAQSALSQQIRRLEQQVGVELFARSSRLVALSDSGHAMLEPARAALRATAQAERAAQEASATSARQLRVGVDMELEDMVPAVLAYAQARSDVALWLSRLHEPQGQDLLATSQIDAFVGFLPPTDASAVPRIRTIDIPLSAVVSPDHPLARRPSVTLSAFRQSPIAVFERAQSPRRFDHFVDVLSEGRGPSSLALRALAATGTGSQVAILAEVSAGQAVSFGTSATVAGLSHLRSLPFDPPLHVPAYVSWHAERSVVADELVKHLARTT